MYKSFYGFESSGFKMTSDRNLRFWHDGYTKVFETLLRSIRRRNGFAVLTGAPGTGKTSLIDDLAAQCEGDGCVVGKVADSLVYADDLPRLVGFAFGLQADTLSKVKLLTLLKEHLIGKGSGGRPVILLVDEAQDLSEDAIEELHLLFDLIARRGRIAQIVLAGQERLLERLHRPECEQIQRLVVESCRLLPLSPRETRAYVAHALKHMGWTGDPEVSADALRLIHQRTGGVPLLINLTMGRLLLHGSLGEVHALDLHDVESVLEQLAEDHPELRRDRSKPRLHSAIDQPILPLDARAAQGSEPHEPSLRERFFSAINRNKRLEEVQSLLDRFQGIVAWSWKRALAGFSVVAISVYMIVVISFEGDESISSTIHQRGQGGQPGIATTDTEGQTAPDGAETPLDQNAYMKPLETPRQAVATRQGAEETKNLVTESVDGELAVTVTGLEPNADAHQGPFADAPATVTSKEVVDADPVGSERMEGLAQQTEPDPEINELLAQAEQALSNNRLTVPSGDNAYLYYQKVLALDPGNAQARDGMQRILERYRQLAQQRLNKRDRRGARLYASRGLKIWPGDRTLSAIKRQTVKRRVARKERGPPEQAPEVPDILERVEKWFRSGRTDRSEFLDQ